MLTPPRSSATSTRTPPVCWSTASGKLVFERYFGAGGINVLNNTRSATKTLTALIVGQAIADGALRSAEQPALSPCYRSSRLYRSDGELKQRITLMDLLTMSSALDCNDFDERNVGNEENMYPLTNWALMGGGPPRESRLLAQAQAVEVRSRTARPGPFSWDR